MTQLPYFIIRGISGVFLAAVLSGVGLLAAMALWFPGLILPIGPSSVYRLLFITSGIGIGAGLGGFVGWLRPEESWSIIFTTLAIALAGGIFGAWIGLGYSGYILYDWAGLTNITKVSQYWVSAAFGGVIGSNGLLILACIYWVGRGQKL